MAGIAREYPEDYEQRVEDVFDRADDRAYTRAQIAAAEAAERMTPEEMAAEDARLQDEALRRAEIESGSEWEPEGDD